MKKRASANGGNGGLVLAGSSNESHKNPRAVTLSVNSAKMRLRLLDLNIGGVMRNTSPIIN
jgi:hypothetical protein